MLVVVHHRDVESLLQTLFYIETLWRLDVLKVNAAECGSNLLNCLAELHGVFLINLNIEDVDAAVYLEKQAFTLHNGLTTHGTNIAQSQHGSTVRDNCNKITLVRIFVGIIGILLNLQTGISHTWRISQREVGLGTISLRRLYFNLARTPRFMIFKGSFFGYFYHNKVGLNDISSLINAQNYKKLVKNVSFFNFIFYLCSKNLYICKK